MREGKIEGRGKERDREGGRQRERERRGEGRERDIYYIHIGLYSLVFSG